MGTSATRTRNRPWAASETLIDQGFVAAATEVNTSGANKTKKGRLRFFLPFRTTAYLSAALILLAVGIGVGRSAFFSSSQAARDHSPGFVPAPSADSGHVEVLSQLGLTAQNLRQPASPASARSPTLAAEQNRQIDDDPSVRGSTALPDHIGESRSPLSGSDASNPEGVHGLLFPVSERIKARCRQWEEDENCREMFDQLANFAVETRDPLWAPQMEAGIEKLVRNDPRANVIRALECRRSLCVVEIATPYELFMFIADPAYEGLRGMGLHWGFEMSAVEATADTFGVKVHVMLTVLERVE